MLLTDKVEIKMCINQLLAICDVENTPVAFNRCHRNLSLVRAYHKVKLEWIAV